MKEWVRAERASQAIGATLLAIFVGVFVSVIAAVVTIGDGAATFTLVGEAEVFDGKVHGRHW